MLRRCLLFLFLSIFLIHFINASYNTFSLENFAENIFDFFDASTIILGSLFILFFIPVNFALRRYFKNDSWAGIGAFCVSFLIIYVLNKSGFDFSSLFFSFGLSENLLYSILPVIFLIGFIIFIWYFSFSAFFLSSGLILFILTIFTNLIYEKGAALVFGAILFLIGVWLWNKGNKGNTGVRVNNLVKPMDKIKNVSGSSSPSKPSGWIHGGKVLNLDMVERKKAWQKKLNALYEDNARLAKRNNGRIPARGTSDGERRAKNMKSIKVLENLIRSQ